MRFVRVPTKGAGTTASSSPNDRTCSLARGSRACRDGRTGSPARFPATPVVTNTTVLTFYLANAAAALHHRDPEASDLAEWIADRENRVAFGRRKRPSPIRAGPGKRGRDEGLSGGNWRSLQAALREEYSAVRKAR